MNLTTWVVTYLKKYEERKATNREPDNLGSYGMPMKNIRVLIFDCDGVMFDSRQSNISYYNHLLEHFDLHPMTKGQIAYVHAHDHSFRPRCL